MAKAKAKQPVKIIAYKAFDKDLKCRGFQFAVGKTYKHDGPVSLCSSGFHACTNPMDVWGYYDLTDTRYCEVELSGDIGGPKGDSKLAAAEITIKAELVLPDFIKCAVSRAIDLVGATAKDGAKRTEAASGGYSKLAASGNGSKLAASGERSHLAASGERSHLAASGGYSKLAASGNGSKLAASGERSHLAASGYYSHLAASGHSSHLAASGHSSQLAASGYYSQLAASGYYSQLAASGYYSKLAASGGYSKLAASGEDSVIASSAIAAMAKGAPGTWISLAEFDGDDKCIGFATGKVGDDGLNADTWYRAKGGKLVAV